MPFEQDGTRDGAERRPAMTARFAELLDRRSTPWELVTGTPEERLRQASAAVDRVVAAGWHFAAPLG